MKAPVALKKPVVIRQHGSERIDNYQWLRDKNWQKFIAGDLDFDNPEVLAYIKQENTYKDHMMADYKEVEKTLYHEILSRIKEDDESWPVKKGDYFYYYREEKGKDYEILCRKHRSKEAPEEIYFDINKEAEGKDLYMFGPSATNRAQTYFAYGYNLTGSMDRAIKVRDLATGKDLDWEFANSTGSFLWGDNEHLYIIERDEFARGKNLYKINIHKGPEHKQLIFSKPEKYDSMFMSLSQTNDRNYFLLYLETGSTHVIYVSEKGTDQFHEFALGENDVTFNIDHFKGEFYILTNLGEANNYKVMKCPVEQDKWPQQNWQEFIGQEEAICLNGITFYNRFLVIERKNNQKALDEIAVMDMSSGNVSYINMPDQAYDLVFSGDWDHNASTVRLDYDSPVSPNKVLELDLKTGKTREAYTKQIPNYDASNYVVKREFAKARDGELVPVTLIHKKGLLLNGKNKAFVYGYGSYGYGMTAHFSSRIFSLIDRGFVYAIAHIRGGDDKGYSWYLDGKMHNKMNTFYDFIDSCEYLINQGYTAKGQIAINGGSAGGLLMGAVTNLRPDLFGCVVADVAFVDVINTINDDSLPLTPPEWEEWGNPITRKEDFEYIMQYSPYDNITAQNYPPMLFNSGISDEQVTYWEPTKMVAKLRALKTDNNPLLLNLKMHSGHAGASKRYEWIEEAAFDYAFILKCLEK
ncbi:prolyl oligopeptidase family serine peptidase [Endozoicomonas sp. Mp262]|uniref:S9 family peptidase n=1 Tax=Endozoicomonas sp. Mp262 TaxID=2919499 RepID=UPI0021DB345B